MKVSKHIDWLSITLPGVTKWQNFIPRAQWRNEGRGRHGYGQMWRDLHSQATAETASLRDEMGTHLTLSGDVLSWLRDNDLETDETIIGRIAEWQGKCSRIDLAIDCYGASVTPRDLETALENRTASISARTWRFINGRRGRNAGETLDTGSPKSDRRFRFYDKRAEQRIKDGEAWVRLELQLRRMYARAAISACREGTVSGVVGSAIGAYLKWSHTEYQTAIATDTLVMAPISRRETARKRWLLGQVAKALASELHDDPEFYPKMRRAVKAFMQAIDDTDK